MDNIVKKLKKNKYIIEKKQFLSISILLILAGIILELLFHNNPIIKVDNNYAHSLFAAIVTISTISVTILTVIINSSDRKYLGFNINEIVNFKSKYFRMNYIIPIILILDLFSAICLTKKYSNLLGLLFFITSLFLVNFSIFIWRVNTDSKFCIDLVKGYIKNNITNNLNMINKFFEGLFFYLENNQLNNILLNIDIIIELVNNLDESQYKASADNEKLKSYNEFINKLYSNINQAFILAEKHYSLFFALDNIFIIFIKVNSKINNKSNPEIETIRNSIEKFQFYNDNQLFIPEIYNLVSYLEDFSNISNQQKEFIIYNLFFNIYKNEILSDNIKSNILERIISDLVFYRKMSEDFNRVKQRILLTIIRNFILLNPSESVSNNLMAILSEKLYQKMFYSDNLIYETVSLIYLLFYVYSFKEVETINEKHRTIIKNLIYSTNDKITTNPISFRYILCYQYNYSKIEYSLWNLSDDIFNKYSYLEYFPHDFVSKSPNWELNVGINFAIYYYLINWYNSSLEITKKDFWNFHRLYAKALLDMFDEKQFILKEKYLNEFNQLAKWIDVKPVLSIEKQKQIFDFVNLNYSEIYIKEQNSIKNEQFDFDIDLLNRLLCKTLVEKEFIGFNNQIKYSKNKILKLKTLINKNYHKIENQIIEIIIMYYFNRIYNSFIKDKTKTIKIGFDLSSVKILLSCLEKNNYKYRNFDYTNDLAFSKETQSTTDFIQLEEKTKKIEYKKTKNINSRLFFNDNDLNFNLIITSCTSIELNETELEEQIEQYKISENIYKIDSIYINRENIINIIKKKYCNLLIVMNLQTEEQVKGLRIEVTL